MRFAWVLPLAIAALIAALPWLGLVGPFLQRELLLAAIFGLVVAGFNLAFGYGGQLALGQVAVFAGGAFTTAILYEHHHTDLVLAIIVAVAFAAFLGLLTGLPGLAFSDWALALVAFFLVLLIPHVTEIFQNETHGVNGIPGILNPTLFGWKVSPQWFYVLVIAVATVCLLLYRNLLLSRYGHTLLVLKHGSMLAKSIGLSPFRVRLSAYVLAGLPGGVAGVFYAYYSTYIQQDIFNFNMVTLILAASVVGGTSSMWAAPIAAGIFILVPDRLSGFSQYSVLAYGFFLVLAGVGLSGGLSGASRAGLKYARSKVARARAEGGSGEPVTAAVKVRPKLALAGKTLSVKGVTKAFGGVDALRGVDLEAGPGEITAIIGANGAGKTTLLNAVSGLVPADKGEVLLGDRVITRLRAESIARAGVSRTFQTPQVPAALTVLEVAESGRISKTTVTAASIAIRSPRYRRTRTADRRHGHAALEFVGLDGLSDAIAEKLPLGQRRILEVARTIAAEPNVVLLDEPAAGLDGETLDDLRSVLVALREAGATVVLIEHNVRFVMDVADRVIVMDLGVVIGDGSPDEIRNDERVIASYLGRRGSHPTADAVVPDEVGDARR